MSRAKNPKYKSMSLEELKVNIEKSKKELEQEEVQDVMEQLQNSSYNKSIVRQVHIAALHKEQQQIAEAVEKAERGDDG